MKATLCLLLVLALIEATPVLAAKSGKPGKPSGPPTTPVPSAELRRMIDNTLPKIATISNPKQPPFNRTKLIEAQADFTAKAQTAPPAQQPMYQAALVVVTNLVGAVGEHEKAVADYHYSKNVHGKQDREDSKVSNPQRGWDAGAAGRAANAKESMENAASRKALLDKEKFMNNGAIATWTQRVGQLHDLVEQSYTAELVAEKQLAMVTPATPPPAPKPAPKPTEASAADAYSPVGTWKAATAANLIIENDGHALRGGNSGTWKWTDQSKGNLHIIWASGLTVDLNLPADGHTLSGKNSNGVELHFTRVK